MTLPVKTLGNARRVLCTSKVLKSLPGRDAQSNTDLSGYKQTNISQNHVLAKNSRSDVEQNPNEKELKSGRVLLNKLKQISRQQQHMTNINKSFGFLLE